MIKHIHVSEADEDDSVRNAYHMLAAESNSHNLSSPLPMIHRRHGRVYGRSSPRTRFAILFGELPRTHYQPSKI